MWMELEPALLEARLAAREVVLLAFAVPLAVVAVDAVLLAVVAVVVVVAALMALSMAAALAWAMAAIINITGRPDIQSPLLRGGIRHCCDFCLPNMLILLCNNSKGRVTPATNQERYPIHQMAFWVRQKKCRFI